MILWNNKLKNLILNNEENYEEINSSYRCTYDNRKRPLEIVDQIMIINSINQNNITPIHVY